MFELIVHCLDDAVIVLASLAIIPIWLLMPVRECERMRRGRVESLHVEGDGHVGDPQCRFDVMKLRTLVQEDLWRERLGLHSTEKRLTFIAIFIFLNPNFSNSAQRPRFSSKICKKRSMPYWSEKALIHNSSTPRGGVFVEAVEAEASLKM
jgi:hypothetical protein